MDFGLTEDQAAVRDAVRKFARDQPAARYLAGAKGEVFRWELHRQVAGLGVLGLLAGPEHNLFRKRTTWRRGWPSRSWPTQTST